MPESGNEWPDDGLEILPVANEEYGGLLRTTLNLPKPESTSDIRV